MKRVLIVTESEKSSVFLQYALDGLPFEEVCTAPAAEEARKLFESQAFDLCIINTPLLDEFGENLARDIASQEVCEVILLIKEEQFESVAERVEAYGAFCVAKPVNRQVLMTTLKLANTAHTKILRIYTENKRLLKKIEDIKIIDRAKCLLISYLSMSEKEAHRYIEKQAMDMRQSRRIVAESVIKTYEY